MTEQYDGGAVPAPPAERHRAFAGAFTTRVRGTRDWEAPAPVAGWTARDVVEHLVDWFPSFVASGSEHGWVPGPAVSDDPAAAWDHQTEHVQALLDDPQAAASEFHHPRLPAMPLGQAIDTFYTSDVFMHTWDLARATGQDETLDAETCAVMLAGMEPIEEMLRASGQYGERVDVPDDADVQTRLIGFIGRDPGWRPPATAGS